ncbi:MAG: hypothetical protein CMJ89_18895 [Planctomycetes bacterium]|nr:hypothetical protein [Planctomycetota bacterium]
MQGLLLCLLCTLPASTRTPADAEDDPVPWYAWLETTGGPLGFGIEFEKSEEADGWIAYLVNEPERIPIRDVSWNGDELTLDIPHYDSCIRAKRDGRELRGTWTKRRGKDKVAVVPFRARPGNALPARPTLTVLPKYVAGRWAVDFESDELPAVGVFEQEVGSNKLHGTFLTATGDYRYLSGHVAAAELTLSCFDGAHAFLFKATVLPDGSLRGDFYSGNWWHDTWTARREDSVKTVDAFRQTSWSERASLADIHFPDTQGKMRSLAEPAFDGQAYLVQVFGSWCPNCHDESRYLVELDQRYRERGLSILGLAFELTGEFERDSEQVEIFKRRHGIRYPLLIAGSAAKADATRALGVLDRVRSYPTTIFLSGDGRVRAIHSGFSGPATGEEHRALRAEFEGLIERLLAEETNTAQLRGTLLACTWRVSKNGTETATIEFREHDGELVARRGGAEGSALPVHLLADAVYMAGRTYRYDAQAKVLFDVSDFSRRITPSRASLTPIFGERTPQVDTLRHRLASQSPFVRREAIVAAAYAHPELLEETWDVLAEDPNLEVRLAHAWATGFLSLQGKRAALARNLEHPNAMLRRETVRALLRLGRDDENALRHLAAMASDPDPLIRKLVRDGAR